MAVRDGSKVTTDHEFIRDWVERRGGCPTVTARGRHVGAVRIDYPDASGRATPEPIGWDEFFDWFERHQLAFRYSEARATFVDRSSIIGARASRRRT